jgi:ketosteroid isomerase-like protein
LSRARSERDVVAAVYDRRPSIDAQITQMFRARAIAAFFALAILGSTSLSAAEPKSEIETVLRAQEEAWNRGDIEGFMNGYWRSEKTVFVSGDEVSRGWQKVLDRYKKKYSDRAKMGTLTFSDLEITPMSDDSAVVLGGWKLKRANDPASQGSGVTSEPHGRFTLVFRKFPDGWKIVHDHTSAAEPKS